jgi:predicted metal-dependent hydrolase
LLGNFQQISQLYQWVIFEQCVRGGLPVDYGFGIQGPQLFQVPPAHQAKRREVLREWYIARAKEKILARAEHHARQLGVKFGAASIVDNRYRWGSCTVNDNVSFNWRLIKAPMFVIDYVIVHELAHLIEANHTARFWSIVRAKSPTMEKAKAWLKEHGQVLEEEI